MADWSVRIVVDANGNTVFQTQLQPGNSSTTYMAPGDTLSWNNTTKQTLQPAITAADGTQIFQTAPIAPDESSRPAWVAPKPAPATYTCTAKLEDLSTVRGSIVVDNPPK